jgi:hypothetical protein
MEAGFRVTGGPERKRSQGHGSKAKQPHGRPCRCNAVQKLGRFSGRALRGRLTKVPITCGPPPMICRVATEQGIGYGALEPTRSVHTVLKPKGSPRTQCARHGQTSCAPLLQGAAKWGTPWRAWESRPRGTETVSKGPSDSPSPSRDDCPVAGRWHHGLSIRCQVAHQHMRHRVLLLHLRQRPYRTEGTSTRYQGYPDFRGQVGLDTSGLTPL